MRVLLLHADHIEYEATKKALRSAETQVPLDGSEDNALVVFTTVEPGDENVLDEVVEDILSQLKRLKVNKVVIYPYAHLSTNLERPWKAVEVLRKMEQMLKERGIEVKRAPFGWYKRFSISVKGHPLAELSRRYYPKGKKVKVLKTFALTPDGEEVEVDKCDEEELKALVSPPEPDEEKIELIRRFCERFGIIKPSLSPEGYFAHLPLAYFMFLAFTVYISSKIHEFDIPIVPLKTPEVVTYPGGLPTVDGYLRHNEVLQHIDIARDEEKPVGIFEMALLFREEEVEPCYRAKEFTVPRFRVIVDETGDLYSILLSMHELVHNEAEKLGRRYVTSYTVTKGMYEKFKDLIVKLVKRDNRCALIRIVEAKEEMMDAEMHIIDVGGRPVEIGSWKVEKYNSSYSISTAPLGSYERFMYMIFDNAARDYLNGKPPELPLWLAPIQVRIIPESRNNLAYAMEVAEELKSKGVRVDIDDRDVPVAEKIRDAGKEWVPYVLLVGEREEELRRVIVVKRNNDREDMSVEELLKLIAENLGEYPQLPQTLPILYSKRPKIARPR